MGQGAIYAQMPFETALGNASVQLSDDAGNDLGSDNIPITNIQPTLVADNAVRPVLKDDGNEVGPDNPVQPGDTILIRYTGQGPVVPPVPTGDVRADVIVSIPASPIVASLGGKTANIVSPQMSSTMPGVLEVRLQVPDLFSDDYYVQIKIGAVSSPSAPVRVQK